MHDNFFQIKNYTINNIFQSKYLNLTCSWLPDHQTGRKNGRIEGCSESTQQPLCKCCCCLLRRCWTTAALFMAASRFVFTAPTISNLLTLKSLSQLCSMVHAHDAERALAQLFHTDVCWCVSVVRLRAAYVFSDLFLQPDDCLRSRWILSHHWQVLLSFFSPLLKMKLSLAIVRFLCYAIHLIHAVVHFRKTITSRL